MLFSSRFMPCTDCGASVERATTLQHRCEQDRLVDYQLFGMRGAIARFEADLRGYLHSTAGRFEIWLAARHVRARWR